MERHVIKVHINVIPQVDGIENVIENCLQEMFKTIEKEPLNSVKINTSHILPNKMTPSIMCVQYDIAFEDFNYYLNHCMNISPKHKFGQIYWLCSMCGTILEYMDDFEDHS